MLKATCNQSFGYRLLSSCVHSFAMGDVNLYLHNVDKNSEEALRIATDAARSLAPIRESIRATTG